jgi:hypothetical protein
MVKMFNFYSSCCRQITKLLTIGSQNPKYYYESRGHSSLAKCYLLKTKKILIAFILLIFYFVIMDIILFNKLQHRQKNVQSSEQNGSYSKKVSIFTNISVKKIMIAEATHFIRSPLSEFIEFNLHFSEIFPFINANMISLFHCFLSVVSIRFLINDSLFWRQIGVAIFQFRNFLDSFDGTIFRAHAHKNVYKSNYGSFG